MVVLPDVAAAGLTVDAVVGAGVGFATDAVLVGAGGVDLVAVTDGLGTDVEVATGFDSGAAGAVLAVVAAVVGDVAATGLGTDVGLPDVPAVGAVVTGDFTLGNATAGFVCGAGGVDLPEDTVILGVTKGAGAATADDTLPEPVETDPLPEFTDEPLPDGLGTELTLMGFRRIVPLEPPDAGSCAPAAGACSSTAEAATAARNRFLKLNNMMTPCWLNTRSKIGRDSNTTDKTNQKDNLGRKQPQVAFRQREATACLFPVASRPHKGAHKGPGVLPESQILWSEQNAPSIQTTGTLQTSQTPRTPK